MERFPKKQESRILDKDIKVGAIFFNKKDGRRIEILKRYSKNLGITYNVIYKDSLGNKADIPESDFLNQYRYPDGDEDMFNFS
jgi:hypothetical protein